MKIVFTGAGGKAGSWIMRGIQMAATNSEWKAVPKGLKTDLYGADAVVLVKRVPRETLAAIKTWGGPLIYDALDFWRQPEEAAGISTAKEACLRFQKHFASIDAKIVLTTNTLMKVDLESVCHRTEVLPHHYDPALKTGMVKEARTLVYFGHPRYLEGWANPIRAACAENRVKFEVNPATPEYASAMIGVRGGQYDTWLDHRWKSSVKGATAMALGVPFLAQPDWSYVEFCGSHLWQFTTIDQLTLGIRDAFGRLDTVKPSDRFSIQKMAQKLEAILET